MSKNFDRRSSLLSRSLLSVAVAGAVAMGGCASPFGASESADTQFTDAVLAKSLMQGSFRGEQLGQEPTVAQGVKELARVDSADTPAPPAGDAAVSPPNNTGASTVTPPAAVPNNQPLANEPLGSGSDEANQAGLASATLNQAEPIFNLSLQDAIARACKNSLAIKVESYNPAIKESQIIQAEAAFDPVLFGYLNWQATDEPVLTPATGQNGQNIQHQIGIKQLTNYGGTASLTASQTWRYINPHDPNNSNPVNFTTGKDFHNSYTENLNASLTQPLLRGFGPAVNEANIYLAQRERRISLATFRRQVITSVADVEAAYHNLVLARTIVDIQERLLVASEDTRQRVLGRIKIDADKISVSQSKAAVEARRAELVRARANLRNQSDILKGLLNDPELNIRSNTLINPTDRPTAEFIVTSTADAIETALKQRTELQEARLQIEKADIVITVAKNDLLPKLDLTLGIQTNGLDNRFDDAFASTVGSHYLDFNAGIRFEFPIGDRDAGAKLNQHKLERSQALTQLLATAQKVVQDVKQQLRDMLTSYSEIQARERARISAAEELQAIIQKEEIVALTPEFLQLKLDSQGRLATAEQNLIQAMVNYNIALMRFEQSKGTLLEFNRISLDRAPASKYADDVGKINFMGQTYQIK